MEAIAHQFRKGTLFMFTGRVLIYLSFYLSLCIVLAGCGSHSSMNGSPAPTPTPTPAPLSSEMVYVAGNGQIFGFSFNPNTAVLGTATVTVGPPTACDMTADSAGSFLYVCDFNANAVQGFAINRSTGSLTQISGSPFSLASGGNGGALTVDPMRRFLFYTDSFGHIGTFTINSGTGALTPTAFAVQDSNQPIQFVVDPGSKFLYAANHANFTGSGEFSGFSINANGSLTPLPGSPFFAFQANSQPFGIVMHSTGRFLYSALSNAQRVAAMNVNGTTGVLTSVPGSPFGAGFAPENLALDPSGKFLYVGNIGDGTMSMYTVDQTTGVLTAMPGSPLSEGNPSALAVDPSGKFLLITESTIKQLTLFRIDPTTGALTRLGSTPFPSGTFPYLLTIVRLQ
jgi:6-phosphogluconolactonase